MQTMRSSPLECVVQQDAATPDRFDFSFLQVFALLGMVDEKLCQTLLSQVFVLRPVVFGESGPQSTSRFMGFTHLAISLEKTHVSPAPLVREHSSAPSLTEVSDSE